VTKILVVEDEESVLDPLELLLTKEGFSIITARDGKEALEKFDQSSPDLILLDLMLPEISGTQVCRQIRSKSSVPIIMLTAKDTEVDKVVGLELGADDYIVKPYSKAELVARIKAVLRRQKTETQSGDLGLISAGPVSIDIDRHLVTINGSTISLPLKEFELLEFLARNKGRVLTRTQLIDRVWGSDYFGDTKTLDVHVKRLRAKIEKDPANPVYIQTIRGLGYKFEG
jgi:two-component system response regulator RegX3